MSTADSILYPHGPGVIDSRTLRNRPEFPAYRQITASRTASNPCPLGFGLFILLNAVLLVRPQELVEDLADAPIYQVVLILCLLSSLPAIAARFRWSALIRHPVSICVLGLLPVIAVSQLVQFRLGTAFDAAINFSRAVTYYILMVSLLTSYSRIRRFCLWLAAFVVFLTILALLQYYGAIQFASLQEFTWVTTNQLTGEEIVTRRLQGTGMLNDPNDLCLVLLVVMAFSTYWLTDRAAGPFRLIWLAPLALFSYALALTQSRGGLLGLLAGVFVLFQARFGWKRSLPLAVLVLPLLLFFYAGRQTDIDVADKEDSVQSRFVLWREAMTYFKQTPLVGIGYGSFEEQEQFVVHNSYLHSFAELGIVGGTLFTGVFFLSASSLRRLQYRATEHPHPDVARLRPYLLSALVAYGVGVFSLSRVYVVPTYIMPGLAMAYVSLPGVAAGMGLPRLNAKWIVRLIGASFATLLVLYLLVKVL